jgi:glycosyltransferase involved in cell wall biosynthesis
MNRPSKKILQIITGLGVGGAETMMVKLTDQLTANGYKVAVISLSREEKYSSDLDAKGIRVEHLNLNPRKPNPIKLLKLISIIRDIDPDIIQTWMYHADLLGGLAARFGRRKVRLYWNIRHSTFDNVHTRRMTIIIARLCAKLSHFLPDRIFCVSNKSKEIHANLGYDRGKLKVIHNGFDVNRFRPDPDSSKLMRELLKIPKNALILGNIARFDPQKDHKTLLEGFFRAAELDSRLHLVLVGKNIDDNNEQLNNLIRNSKMSNRVYLLGFSSDVESIYRMFDIFILSSRYGEGFPNVLGEAMASGVPCISTDVGDSKEIIASHGRLFNSGDPEDLANVIIQFLTKEYLDGKLSKQCRAHIMEHYDIRIIAQRYMSEYQENK